MSERELPIHEYIPSAEIIEGFFNMLTEGKEYVETKKLEDEKEYINGI